MMKIIMSILVLLTTFSCSMKSLPDKSKIIIAPAKESGMLVENTKGSMKYYLYLPKNWNSSDEGPFPLLISLHGSGQSGSQLTPDVFSTTVLYKLKNLLLDQNKAKVQAYLGSLDEQVKNSIILFPQNLSPSSWNIDAVHSLVDTVKKMFPVDDKRIYMTGVSLGGMGTWNYAVKYANELAAVAPVCGTYAILSSADKISNLPSWVFHAIDDDVVRFGKSYSRFLEKLTADDNDELLESYGSLEKGDYSNSGTSSFSGWQKGVVFPSGIHSLTLYAGGGHHIWNKTYDLPELVVWLYQQKKN